MTSNGLYQPELYPYLESVTWILESKDGVGICIGSTLVPDHVLVNSNAYRSEISGLLTGILSIFLVCINHQIYGGCIEVSYNG